MSGPRHFAEEVVEALAAGSSVALVMPNRPELERVAGHLRTITPSNVQWIEVQEVTAPPVEAATNALELRTRPDELRDGRWVARHKDLGRRIAYDDLKST